ncbi:MAG: hypothetical protein Q8P82_01635, partial [bacterium]|nr:hypothetical protein [bacterium]
MAFSVAFHTRFQKLPRALIIKRLKFLGLFFVLVIAYSVAAFRSPATVFNSPDEMANSFFAENVMSENRLRILEPLESITNGAVHPRSIAVRGEYLVPGSFHGLPVLYGLFAKITSARFIPFFTAFLAALGVFAWYAVMRTAFGTRAAVVASALLAATP